MPGPEVSHSRNGSWPAFDLRDKDTPRGYAEQINLVNRATVSHELEVRPHMDIRRGRQILTNEIQRGLFPGKCRGCDSGPRHRFGFKRCLLEPPALAEVRGGAGQPQQERVRE